MQKVRRRGTGSGHFRGQRGSSSQHSQRRMLNRGSEPERGYFRCDRYFTVGHEWYATTREGQDIGPFATRNQAKMALANHLAERVFDIPGKTGQLAVHSEREMTELEVLIQEFATCRQHAQFRSENSAYVWAQQRLVRFEEHSVEHAHAGIRASALRHFLSELDG